MPGILCTRRTLPGISHTVLISTDLSHTTTTTVLRVKNVNQLGQFEKLRPRFRMTTSAAWTSKTSRTQQCLSIILIHVDQARHAAGNPKLAAPASVPSCAACDRVPSYMATAIQQQVASVDVDQTSFRSAEKKWFSVSTYGFSALRFHICAFRFPHVKFILCLFREKISRRRVGSTCICLPFHLSNSIQVPVSIYMRSFVFWHPSYSYTRTIQRTLLCRMYTRQTLGCRVRLLASAIVVAE